MPRDFVLGKEENNSFDLFLLPPITPAVDGRLERIERCLLPGEFNLFLEKLEDWGLDGLILLPLLSSP